MRGPGTDDRAGDLNDHVEGADTQVELAPKGEDQGDGGIEMCAGHRAEDGDQHNETGTRGDGVAEECDRNIATGQALTHDPGAYDHREEQSRAESLRRPTRPEIEALKRRL